MSTEMKEYKHLQTSFHFKTLPNGLVDEDIVVCNLGLSELKCHISTISLTYHLKPKHTSMKTAMVSQGALQTTDKWLLDDV